MIVRGAFEVFPELLLALGARVSISTTAFGGKAMKLFFCRRGVMPARQTFAGVAAVLVAARQLLSSHKSQLCGSLQRCAVQHAGALELPRALIESTEMRQVQLSDAYPGRNKRSRAS